MIFIFSIVNFAKALDNKELYEKQYNLTVSKWSKSTKENKLTFISRYKTSFNTSKKYYTAESFKNSVQVQDKVVISNEISFELSSTSLNLICTDNDILKVIICDLLGKIIIDNQVFSKSLLLDRTTLPKGLLICNALSSNGKLHSFKFVN